MMFESLAKAAPQFISETVIAAIFRGGFRDIDIDDFDLCSASKISSDSPTPSDGINEHDSGFVFKYLPHDPSGQNLRIRRVIGQNLQHDIPFATKDHRGIASCANIH